MKAPAKSARVQLLHLAHARSGDSVAIASYLGSGDAFDRAVAQFAETYADQNERDYNALIDAFKAGGISAETGV
jgi:predicted alpha/beta hydrolase